MQISVGTRVLLSCNDRGGQSAGGSRGDFFDCVTLNVYHRCLRQQMRNFGRLFPHAGRKEDIMLF